jgi:hypothetical protein
MSMPVDYWQQLAGDKPQADASSDEQDEEYRAAA